MPLIQQDSAAVSEEITIHPPKRLLFGPGPTQVHPRVYQAMAQPIVGHLDPYFFEVSQNNQHMLRHVFGTENEWTFVISATGSGGMETAISNFVDPGMKVAVFANGFFCDRMTEMAHRHGGDVVRFEKPWGGAFGDSEAAEFVHREKPKIVMYVTAETSTGLSAWRSHLSGGARGWSAGHRRLRHLARRHARQRGQNRHRHCLPCTQKGLSCPPGLSPITVSPRAVEWLQARKSTNRSWYFDIKLIGDYLFVSRHYHHTASATLFYALHEGLSLIEEEGLENRWERHRHAHLEFVKSIGAMGLEMLVPAEYRIWNLNTPQVPEGVDDAKVRATLLKDDGIEIAGGFGPLAGKVFRIGLMGPLATSDHVQDFLARFGAALRGAGYRG